MKNRDNYIGGSDACRIIAGDWLSLWEEKQVVKNLRIYLKN